MRRKSHDSIDIGLKELLDGLGRGKLWQGSHGVWLLGCCVGMRGCVLAWYRREVTPLPTNPVIS
jgi:hypothetical protein